MLLESCTEVAVCTASVCQNSIVLEGGITTIQNLGPHIVWLLHQDALKSVTSQKCFGFWNDP